MATDFIKLYRSFFLGSMRDAPPWTRLVFQACISLADDTGVFVARPDAIAGFAAIPLEHVESALKELSSPDPNDTSGVEDGRRIMPLGPNKWLVTNYRHYYELNRSAERREYLRQAQQRHRSAQKDAMSTNVNKSTQKEIKEKKRNKIKVKEKKDGDDRFSGAVLPVELLELEPYLDKWITYRKSKKLPPYVKLTWESKFETFQKWGITKTIKAIEYSIENGYQGIFEPKDNNPLDKKPDEVKYRRV